MIMTSKVIRNFAYSIYRKQVNFFHSTSKIPINGSQNFKSFHRNAPLCAKMFTEYENKYAYSLMEDKGYAYTLKIETDNKSTLSKEEYEKILGENWSKKDQKQLFEAFSMLGTYCSEHNICISNKVFDNFIDSLTDSFKLASDEELESIFKSLVKWPETESVRTRNYIEVWVALDEECLKRINSWPFDVMLSYVSLFYMLNVTRVSDFTKKCLQKMASKAKQLTPVQLIQALFFIGILRKQPFDMHNLEVHLESNFERFSADDLAIMSMGFFKSKTPIRSMELVSKIINKVMENSETIHEVSLAALLKVIRYSMKIPVDDKIYKMLDILQYQVPRLSVMCNVHVALVGTSTLTLHKECLTKIADTISTSMPQARLKDLERLVLTYGIFNYVPATKECFFQKVMNELRKPERGFEIEKHGRSFACCIGYLGLLNIYPVDLMSRVLSPSFLEKTYGKQVYLYGKEVLTIHNSSEIFCGDAEMNRLSEKGAQILAKKYTDYIPTEEYSKQYNNAERFFIDVCKIIKEDRGSDYVACDHILTHHQRGDIIICNSEEGQPLPVGETFDTKSFGLLRRPPNDDHWIVIVVVGRNAIIHNTDTATGPYQTKIRELKALGFHATLVPWTVYLKLKTKEEKIQYLNGLIQHAVT